jgi:hypothetical protein
VAQQIDDSLKNMLTTPVLPIRFYATAARNAAKEIENSAKTYFEGELLEKAAAVAEALRAYADELEKE